MRPSARSHISHPHPLPEKLTTRFDPPLMRGILTYCDLTDVTPSRFLQRAAERELLRRAKQQPKLKEKIEKILNGTTNSSRRQQRD